MMRSVACIINVFRLLITIINNDHNDSGWYYKTIIMIVIYDPS
jgi:hypothetical protein